MYLTYKDYGDQWDEIAGVFSREAASCRGSLLWGPTNFGGATTYTCLIYLFVVSGQGRKKECRIAKVEDLTEWRTSGKVVEGSLPAARITSTEWNFAVGRGATLFERLSFTEGISQRISNISNNSLFVPSTFLIHLIGPSTTT